VPPFRRRRHSTGARRRALVVLVEQAVAPPRIHRHSFVWDARRPTSNYQTPEARLSIDDALNIFRARQMGDIVLLYPAARSHPDAHVLEARKFVRVVHWAIQEASGNLTAL
jgi:hypothetical protein